MEAQELGKFQFHGSELKSFPSYIAESTSFAFVHNYVLSSLTVLRLLAVGFPLKNYFCDDVMWFAK